MTRKSAVPTKRRRNRKPRRVGYVHQFLIILANTEPLVWRRIQVPEDYSFWDLHVAIQDAMGWLDYHLHEFTASDLRRGTVLRLGIPDDEFPNERPCLPDWQVAISEHFDERAPPALYLYDFGDDWRHAIIYEGMQSADATVSYPRCIAGARACPPEDCSGVNGFAELLVALADASHPEHAEIRQWVGKDYDPAVFDPGGAHFDNPRERWTIAFSE